MFLELYNQGLTDAEISNIVNISRRNINSFRNNLNLPFNTPAEKHRNTFITLLSQGFTDADISKKLEMPSSNVEYIRKSLKLKSNNRNKNYYTSKENRIKGYMIRNIKSSAKVRNLEFNLTSSDIVLPKYCPILNIELNYTNYNKHSSLNLGDDYISHGYNYYSKPSIDRIDNSKGYIKGNIIIMSRKANTMKNNANFDELELFSKNILNLINFYKNQGARGNITDIFFNNEELSLDS